jgi:hypothetical protein
MSADAPTNTTTHPHHTSPLNPFHHAHGEDATPNDGTPHDGERRRSSAANIVHKIGHALNTERKDSQAAYEAFYGVDHTNVPEERRHSVFAEHASSKKSEADMAAQAVKNVEKDQAKTT